MGRFSGKGAEKYCERNSATDEAEFQEGARNGLSHEAVPGREAIRVSTALGGFHAFELATQVFEIENRFAIQDARERLRGFRNRGREKRTKTE